MFGNLGDLMGKVKDLQANMQAAQEHLSSITETGESGAGLVKATINGHKKLLSLEIDPSIVQPGDTELMADLIVAAVNKALETIEPKIKEHLKSATQGSLPNIPGLDLGSFLK
jgi:DNA-binding YbaB/EbfC family protein